MSDGPTTFAELGLPSELLEHLSSRGITAPTPVQAAVIPLALAGVGQSGGDLLAQARTGSGKTLAYLLPLAAGIRHQGCKRAWVVCPTRELAQQVSREAVLVLGNGAVATLIGGAPWGVQARELAHHPPLVVGTPGRMRDHLDRGTLPSDAEILVLDEADQMLDMGFREELDALVKDLGEGVARWLFSATFPPAVENAVERWLDKPKEVRLDVRQASSHVPQHFVITQRNGEMAALIRLLQVLDAGRALVFTRTRLGVEQTVQGIALAGIEAAGISGDLMQDARERVLARFRSGKLPVLVATDVAARGLDVQGVTHVFNLGLPVGAASYSHRIGRTARAGASGEAWTVITASERLRFQRMASSTGSKPLQSNVPTGAEIVAARRHRLAVRLQESLGEGLSLPSEFAELATAHGAEAVLAALVHRLVPDAPVEKHVPIATPTAQARSQRGGGGETLILAMGEQDGATPAAIVATICRASGAAGAQLGRMRIFPRHTMLEVASEAVESVLRAEIHFRGRSVRIHRDRDTDRGKGPAEPPAPRRDPPAAPVPAAKPIPPRPAPAPAAAQHPPVPPPPRPAPAAKVQEPAPAAAAPAAPAAVAPAAPTAAAPARSHPAAAPVPRPAAARPPEPKPSAPPARPTHAPPAAAAMPLAPPVVPVQAEAPAPAHTAPAPRSTESVAAAQAPAPPRGPAPVHPPAVVRTPGPDDVMVRLKLGRDAGVSVRTLRKFLAKAGGIDKTAIGPIEIGPEQTDAYLPRAASDRIRREGQLRVQDRMVEVLFTP